MVKKKKVRTKKTGEWEEKRNALSVAFCTTMGPAGTCSSPVD